jgi:hypothetical protein|tara:strand:+ start:227 stop:397 length:171 start_codon:yes stop_codon:yes gene_type:complete
MPNDIEKFGVCHIVKTQDDKYNVFCYGFHEYTVDTHDEAVKKARSLDTKENGYTYH